VGAPHRRPHLFKIKSKIFLLIGFEKKLSFNNFFLLFVKEKKGGAKKPNNGRRQLVFGKAPRVRVVGKRQPAPCLCREHHASLHRFGLHGRQAPQAARRKLAAQEPNSPKKIKKNNKWQPKSKSFARSACANPRTRSC